MTVTLESLVKSQYLGTTATELYTSPSGTKTIIDKLTCTNINASARTVTIYIVPAEEVAAANHTLADVVSLSGNTGRVMVELEGHILTAGEKIVALSSAGTSVVIRASGRQIV